MNNEPIKLTTIIAPKQRVTQFLHDLTIVTGVCSYALVAGFAAGYLQMNMQRTGSTYLTQINSVDVDKLVKQMAEQGLESGEWAVDKKGMIVRR